MKKILSVLAAMLMICVAGLAQNQTDTAPKMNKKNLVVKEWNTSMKGNRIMDHITIYSPDGKKIEEAEYDAFGKQKWRKRYEWGENGLMQRELVYDERNKLVDYKKFEYNEFGKKKTQYTYDPKGKLISTKVYEYISQDA
ncbi:MAG: hypothetical protein IJL91_09385 [Bacteroidales bacterium]|nr:hypothetical protein [Bacteroidales bacterium]